MTERVRFDTLAVGASFEALGSKFEKTGSLTGLNIATKVDWIFEHKDMVTPIASTSAVGYFGRINADQKGDPMTDDTNYDDIIEYYNRGGGLICFDEDGESRRYGEIGNDCP